MSRYKWHCSLVLGLLLLLVSFMAGCFMVRGEPAAGLAPAAEPALPASPAPADKTETGIAAAAPADETLVDSDPVSGRNEEVDFTWEQLCLSSQYQVQVAKDAAFTMIIFDSGIYAPPSSTSPALVFPAGAAPSGFGAAPPYMVSQLEAGHTYYWRARVRQAATGQFMLSPWSRPERVTVSAGLPASASYHGLALLSPANGCIGCPVKPVSFSWTPYQDTNKYRFVLAKDAAMTQVVVEANTTTTGYEYQGTLEYSASYFWRVMAVEPAPSDWSATFSFQTQAAPAAAPAPAAPAPTPLWVWVVIAIGTLLIVATIVLIFTARRA